MTSPATRDLVDRLQALAETLEDALLDLPAEHEPRWAPHLITAVASLGAAAASDDPEVQLPRVDEATAAMRAARGDADIPAELAGTLDDALAFATRARARVLDVAATVPRSGPATAAPASLRASVRRPRPHRVVELPSPDLLPRERAFDPAADAAASLDAARVGVSQLRAWLAAGSDDDGVHPAPREDGLVAPRGSTAEIEHLQRLGRDCLEDVGVLGGLRRAEPELPWCFAEAFEERLLANVDALVALDAPRVADGPRLGVARALWRYLREWSVPDPGRAFAFGFVLACAEAEAGPRWVTLTMRRAPARLARAFEDALALGASPAVPAALAALLQGESEPWRLVPAVRAWRRRGDVDVAAVVPLALHPDPAVAAEAIGALGDDASPVGASALHELLVGEPVRAAEAALALARRGDREGLRHLRAVLAAGASDQALGEARAVAARGLAVVGDPRDAEALRAFAVARRDALELLGWHGQPSHVGTLLDGLDADDDAHRRAAAWGLTRLLGRPPGAASDTSGPVRDRTLWRARAASVDLGSLARLQLGAPATSGAAAVHRLADELLAPTTLQRDRAPLRLELELAVARPIPVDLDGWIARQREVIAAARELRGAL